MTGKFRGSLINNSFFPTSTVGDSHNIGQYGYWMDYGDLFVTICSQYPIESDINVVFTIYWSEWWNDHEGGGGNYGDSSQTESMRLRKGESKWTYQMTVTYYRGPSSGTTWGVENLRWQWKTDKPGGIWSDSKYNYMITPFGEEYPDFYFKNPSW